MTEEQKDIQQLSFLRSIFAAIELHDDEGFRKIINDLAALRGESTGKVIFDIICSLDSNINQLLKRKQAA